MIQQCLNTFRITVDECRACNGLDTKCPDYAPNPDPKAARETREDAHGHLPVKLFPEDSRNPFYLQETRYCPLAGCYAYELERRR